MTQVFNRAASALGARRNASRPGARWAWLATGVLLAGAAVANQLVARRSERRHPPAGGFVDIDGVQVHYIEKGAGPTVVLIHGNVVSAEDYRLSGLFDRLAQRHRVIALDRPGFGYSGRPRARAWDAGDQARLTLVALKRLEVTEAILVAHSWGTLVALAAALQQPELVSGLVLMSGYYWPTPRLDALFLSGPAVPGFGDVLRFTLSPPLGWAMAPLMLKQVFAPAEVPAHFKAGFPASMSLRPSQLRATAADTAMMAREAAKTSGRHKEISAPALVMAGDGDRIVSCRHQSQRLARELLGGQLHVVQGAGHMIHHTAPEEVAARSKPSSSRLAEALAPSSPWNPRPRPPVDDERRPRRRLRAPWRRETPASRRL